MVNIASVGTVVIKVVKLVSDIASISPCRGPNTVTEPREWLESMLYVVSVREVAGSIWRLVGKTFFPRGCNQAFGESRPSVITNPIIFVTTPRVVVIKDPRTRHARHEKGSCTCSMVSSRV